MSDSNVRRTPDDENKEILTIEITTQQMTKYNNNNVPLNT